MNIKGIIIALTALVAVSVIALVAYHSGWLERSSPGSGMHGNAVGSLGSATSSLSPSSSTSREGTAASGLAVPASATPPNLLSLEMGARVESVTSQFDDSETAGARLLDANPAGYWSSQKPPTFPQELVFSFLGRQQVLVASALVNPETREPRDRWAKDIEVWSSTESATAGFIKVGATTLRQEGKDQIIAAGPFEARYLKFRILSNHGSPEYVELGKVKALEGERAGYVSLADRDPELTAFLKGGSSTPSVTQESSASVDAVQGDVCTAAPSGPPARAGSRHVLVVGRSKEDYAPLLYSPTDKVAEVDQAIYEQLTFTMVRPEEAWPTLLKPADGIDTVVLAQICDVRTSLPEPFKRALMTWVSDGHKLVIQDADACDAKHIPDYSFLPYRFATSNAGGNFARSDTLFFVEENALANADPQHAGFLDIKAWLTTPGENELGDSNLIKSWDAHWCGQLVAKNVNNTNGFVEAYAHFGRGLIIYDGFDLDQKSGMRYRHLVTRELAQPFDPDGLPCTARLGDFVITTEASLKTQWMAAEQTYSYPLTLLSNQGYKGTVKLSLTPSPADPTVRESFDVDTVAVENLSKANLTVKTTAASPRTTHRLAVRGTDTTGKSNSLCLELAERKNGGIRVVAAAPPQGAQPKKPTKNLEIILDLSGSMKLPLGKSTRIGTAREVLRTVLAKVPDDFNVGLRFYGHRYGSRQKETCTDTELVMPIQPLDRARLLSLVNSTQPRGETPLVYSVLQTPADLKPLGGGAVVLITDGEESCNGDPLAAARQLKDAGIDITLHIVGFTLTGKEVERQLSTFAESTGGHYYSAQSGDQLARALMMAAVEKFPYTVFDASGRQVASGEAGQTAADLPAGEYRVVVRAGDEQLTADHLTVTPGSDTVVKVVLKGDRFAIER